MSEEYAFPTNDVLRDPSGNVVSHIYYGGMTLRDWYAGMALQGWLSSFGPDDSCNKKETALFAFDMADAIMKEREKRNERST